jgi:hypothetical protein
MERGAIARCRFGTLVHRLYPRRDSRRHRRNSAWKCPDEALTAARTIDAIIVKKLTQPYHETFARLG